VPMQLTTFAMELIFQSLPPWRQGQLRNPGENLKKLSDVKGI
jgi:hypothetical protein